MVDGLAAVRHFWQLLRLVVTLTATIGTVFLPVILGANLRTVPTVH